MTVDDTKINITLSLRETQSLLLFVRRIHESRKHGSATVSFTGIPRGAVDDVENMAVELQNALLMSDKPIEHNG